MKRRLLIAGLMAAAVLPQPALADADCIGTITNTAVFGDGAVVVRGTWRSDYTQVCNVKTEWKGITPDVCSSWKAMIDAGLSLSRQVRVYYPGSSWVCSTLPTYGDAPAPQYLMLF
jgi:hypothetical protein